MKLSLKAGTGAGMSKLELPEILNNPKIYMALGLAIMMMMAFLLFSGAGDKLTSTKAFEQGQRAATQMRDTVQTFQRMLQDDQVANLATMALNNPETQAQLSQYLAGRLSEFRDIRLFSSTAYLEKADEQGENSWVVIDMMMTAREQGIAPLQILDSGEDTLVAGLVAIGDVEQPAGFLMVLAAQEVILSSFNMTMPLAGYIALEQNNGRYKSRQIRSFGELAEVNQTLARINVPGSLFRIVVPQSNEESGGGFFAPPGFHTRCRTVGLWAYQTSTRSAPGCRTQRRPWQYGSST